MLEVENLNDFIAELKEGTVVRTAEFDSPMQDGKGEAMVGIMVVYTAKVDDYIVKYVESLGVAKQDSKEAEELYKKKDEAVKANKKTITDKGFGHTYGLWSDHVQG